MDPEVRAILAHALSDYNDRDQLSLQCRLRLELTTYAQKEALCELIVGVRDHYRVSVPMLLYLLDYHYGVDLLKRFRMACRLGLPVETRGLPAGWAISCLGAAARGGHLRLVKELLAAGAHPLPGLCGAAYAGHDKVLRHLLLQHPASEAGPALKSAAQAGRLETVQLLVETGVPVNSEIILGAVTHNHFEIVQLLLPRLEGEDAEQRLLLGSACSMAVARLLMDRFPGQLTARTIEKLLHNAALHGELELFQFALARGASPASLRTRGYTVGIGGSVDILLCLKPVMESELRFYEQALSSAVSRRNHHHMVEYILGLGLELNLDEALNQAAQKSQSCAQSMQGPTGVAQKSPGPWMLPRLLAVPGPKNLQTALVSACVYGHLENVQLLLEAGATPSEEALEAASEFYPDIVELLQSASP